MKSREVYAVYHFDHGWLVDTCAGGKFTGFDTFDEGQREAKTWPDPGSCSRELAETDLELGALGKSFEIVPIEQ